MARARNIKPAFFKNEQLVELGFGTRLLFIGLWTLADREGYLEDRPKRIKMELFPGDDYNVEKGLLELEKAGFIVRYEQHGGRYIHVVKFLCHQNPHHREPPSTIPKPRSGPGLEHDGKDNKPEAIRDSNAHESPGQDLGTPEDSPSTAVRIPDSGFRIPDSGDNTVCPESSAKTRARSRPAARWNGEEVARLPVVAHSEPEVAITREFVDEMQRAYPAIDVEATLPEIRAWCLANPSKRKTPGGIHRFVQSWIAREQNRG